MMISLWQQPRSLTGSTVLALLLSGCSFSGVSKLVPDQFCHTNQVIETQDRQNVSSRSTIKCSDDPIEKYVPARMGIAKDCYEQHIPMNKNGNLIHEKIYVCKKLSGGFDVIEPVRIR